MLIPLTIKIHLKIHLKIQSFAQPEFVQLKLYFALLALELIREDSATLLPHRQSCPALVKACHNYVMLYHNTIVILSCCIISEMINCSYD